MTSIATALGNNENQLITLANGTYTGAQGVFNANPDTTGKYAGFLIIQAATPGGVIIDSTANRMNFQTGSANILFLGCKTQGRIDVAGSNIWFWYPDDSFTTGVNRANLAAFSNSLYNSPDGFNLAGSTHFQMYGADMHDCADVLDTSGASSAFLEGIHVFNQYPTNGSVWHSDVIDGVASGKTTSLTMSNSTLDGRLNGASQPTHGFTLEPATGHSYTCNIDNTWVTGFQGASFDPGGSGTVTINFGDNVYSFNNTQNTVNPGATVTGTLHTTTPSGTIGTDDPATKWRTANPYASWPTFFRFQTPPIVAGSRGVSQGVAPGTIGSTWGSTALTQAFTTDLPTYGESFRHDIRMSQVADATIGGALSAGTGWLPTANRGWGRYDTEFGYGVTGGCTNFVVCVNDITSSYSVHSNGYPSTAHQADVITFWKNLITRYKPGGAGGIPAAANVWFEFLNEANQSFFDSTGQPNVSQYAFWFDQFVTAARATYPQVKIMLGSAAGAPTNKISPDSWTSLFNSSSDPDGGGGNGWNRVNHDGSGNRQYAPLDWFNLLLNNPSGALGTSPTVNGKFDAISHHSYWSSEGPFATSTSRGATFPAFPSTYRLGYGFSHIRDIKDVYQLGVNAGNSPAKCKIHVTESGGTAPTYWNSSTTYHAGDQVFDGAGSWNSGTRKFTVGTRYVSIGTNTNSKPSTHVGSTWNTTTAGWGGAGGSDVYEGDEVGRYIDEILKLWFGDTTDADGVDISQMTGNFYYFNALDNSTDGSNIQKGLRTFDGSNAKGSTTGTSTLERMVAQALLSDDRTTVVVHANPTVSITAPAVNGIIVSGGPVLTVSWTYAQADGDAQGSYRVRILNKAETTTYYDSNVGTTWLSGNASSKAINMVSIFGSQFADTSNGALHARVSVRSTLGVNFQGDSAAVPFDIQWGLPKALVTNPTAGQVIQNANYTLQWSYTDTRNSPVQTARYIVTDKNGHVVHDSGTVTPT